MDKLKDSVERVSQVRRSLSDIQVFADDLDAALKSATKVFTPKEVKASAVRISQSARKSAIHPRPIA